MPIEIRTVSDDSGRWWYVVIACYFCGNEIEDVEEGVTVWLPRTPSVRDFAYRVDYAHDACEDRLLAKLPNRNPSDVRMLKEQTSAPLGEFLDMLRER